MEMSFSLGDGIKTVMQPLKEKKLMYFVQTGNQLYILPYALLGR